MDIDTDNRDIPNKQTETCLENEESCLDRNGSKEPFVFNDPIMKPNAYCIIQLPSENIKLVQLSPNSTVSIGKFGSFKVNDILGLPYGYTFEIQEDKRLKIVDMSKDKHELRLGQEAGGLEPTETNDQLFDDNKAQTLSMAEIEQLKSEGISGRDIVDTVIKGHADFHKKTAFSKEKYLKRKEQKYLRRFTPRAVTSSLLLEYYQEKDYRRVIDMCSEMLALTLSMANVQPGGKYLVIDDTTGVLTASIMERLAGDGQIVVLHENEHPNLDALKFFNYPEEITTKIIKTINWLQFLEPESEEEVPEKSAEELNELKPRMRGQYYRKRDRWLELQELNRMLRNSAFDALIMASTLHPPDQLEQLIEAVGGSRPIVVYSEFKEIVSACSQLFLKDRRVLAPTIWESRVRKYQTIIGRMHPLMTSRGGGGYLVHGTRVFSAPVQATVKGRKRSRKKDSDEEENGKPVNP